MIKAKRLLEINDKGQGKAIGINIHVGKKLVLHSPWKIVTVGECNTGKKKTKFKTVGGKSGKKKQRSKSLGKWYRWNLKKSGDGKDIIKKD